LHGSNPLLLPIILLVSIRFKHQLPYALIRPGPGGEGSTPPAPERKKLGASEVNRPNLPLH
jgi:hypothetical protein